MFFDTHCHLNFKAFDGRVDEVLRAAKEIGVDKIIIPGTDIETSKKAIKIAEKRTGVYAAIGIHPHHVYEFLIGPKRLSQKQESSLFLSQELKKIENLLSNKKVVAIGEVGLDRHIYDKTKYYDYKIDEEFIELQKIFLKEQIKLAVEYDKSLILHNREAKKDMFEALNEVWDKKLEGQTVFHCCEPSKKLLEFAVDKKMFIGVDGDLIYYKEKQQFIKEVPLEMLVLETDAPFLSPTRQFPNEPKNILLIAECVAKLKNLSIEEVAQKTTENAKKLFRL
jgi:TatD DNase family protein